MGHKELSVVIICYNMGHLISTALNTLRNQSKKNFEVIIVDNHSEDNTDEIVKLYPDLDIHMYKIFNNGILSISRNYGMEKASCEWVAFLDADDCWEKRKVESVINAISIVGRDVVAISHPSKEVDLNSKKERIIGVGITDGNIRKRLILENNYFALSGMTIRKSAAIEIGGFSVDSSLRTVEDYDMWIRLASLGHFYCINECLAKNILHEGNYSKHADVQMKAFDYLKHKYIDKNDTFTKEEKQHAFKKAEWEQARILQKNGFFSESKQCIQQYKSSYGLNLKIVALIILCFFRIKK